MLPLSLLRTSQNHPILVELKNGETYNGHLVNCDNWMNLNLRKVYCTSRDGDRFWKIPHVYIRGNTIKYLCIQEEVMGLVKEEVEEQKGRTRDQSAGRGRGSARGRGRGGRSRLGIGGGTNRGQGGEGRGDRSDRGDRDRGRGRGKGRGPGTYKK